MSKKNTAPKATEATTDAKATGLKGWVKPPMTVREDGLSYALCSRVLNAMSRDIMGEFEPAKDAVDMTDGRGTVQKVSPRLISVAASLGASFLKTVKSAYLKPRLVVDLDKNTATLKELEKKEAKKEEAVEEKKVKTA